MEPDTKRCPKCDVVKPLDAFATDRSRRDGKRYKCKDCDARAVRERYQGNPAVRQQRRDYYRQTIDARRAYANSDAVKGKNWARKRSAKEAALKIYGGCCSWCGSTEYLQFDHINNDGAAHRAVEPWWAMIFRIARLGAPIDDYELRLLCVDCHRRRTRETWTTPRPLVCRHCGEVI